MAPVVTSISCCRRQDADAFRAFESEGLSNKATSQDRRPVTPRAARLAADWGVSTHMSWELAKTVESARRLAAPTSCRKSTGCWSADLTDSAFDRRADDGSFTTNGVGHAHGAGRRLGIGTISRGVQADSARPQNPKLHRIVREALGGGTREASVLPGPVDWRFDRRAGRDSCVGRGRHAAWSRDSSHPGCGVVATQQTFRAACRARRTCPIAATVARAKCKGAFSRCPA